MDFNYLIPDKKLNEEFDRKLSVLNPAKVVEYCRQFNMFGWYDRVEDNNFSQQKEKFRNINLDVDYIITIGLGGSFQGIEAVSQLSPFRHKFIFIGPALDPFEIQSVFDQIKDKRTGFVIVSKSGGTMEIFLYINLFQKFIRNAEWLFLLSSNQEFITELKTFFSTVKIFETLEIEENIGGRYCLAGNMGITAALLGQMKPENLIDGMADAKKSFLKGSNKIPLERGLLRHLLYNNGKVLENLATNNILLSPVLKWSKQLWAESNGKDRKSMFVSTGFYPEDAHTVGQIWKEGPRKVAETYYYIQNSRDLIIDHQFFKDKVKFKKDSLNQINIDFIEAIMEDRYESGVPISVYKLKEISLYNLGKLFFNEMLGVVTESCLSETNPFNQPGVESYKEKVRKKIL